MAATVAFANIFFSVENRKSCRIRWLNTKPTQSGLNQVCVDTHSTSFYILLQMQTALAERLHFGQKELCVHYLLNYRSVTFNPQHATALFNSWLVIKVWVNFLERQLWNPDPDLKVFPSGKVFVFVSNDKLFFFCLINFKKDTREEMTVIPGSLVEVP